MSGERFVVEPNIRILLRDLGIPMSRVLRRAELPMGLFAGAPIALTPVEYFRLWGALETEADDPALAVRIGRAISVELFNPPIFAALCSSNLEVAARRIATYKPLIGPLGVEVARTRAGLTVGYRWPVGETPPPLLATSELVFWVALARIATRQQIRPVRVTLRQLPSDTEALSEYFGQHLQKGRTDTITFSGEDAARPFLTESEQMWRFFAPELRQRLFDLQTAAGAAERVRAALLETLPAGESSIAEVTKHLATSPRTLQRQLQLEGTSFQAVLASTREQLARHYLSNSAMTTGEIAYMLAYEDTNSFYRAFRSWTGATPESVRTTRPELIV